MYTAPLRWNYPQLLINQYHPDDSSNVARQSGGRKFIADFGLCSFHNSSRPTDDEGENSLLNQLPPQKRLLLKESGLPLPRFMKGTLDDPYVRIVHNQLSNFAMHTFPSLPLSTWEWNGCSVGETIRTVNLLENVLIHIGNKNKNNTNNNNNMHLFREL